MSGDRRDDAHVVDTVQSRSVVHVDDYGSPRPRLVVKDRVHRCQSRGFRSTPPPDGPVSQGRRHHLVVTGGKWFGRFQWSTTQDRSRVVSRHLLNVGELDVTNDESTRLRRATKRLHNIVVKILTKKTTLS